MNIRSRVPLVAALASLVCVAGCGGGAQRNPNTDSGGDDAEAGASGAAGSVGTAGSGGGGVAGQVGTAGMGGSVAGMGGSVAGMGGSVAGMGGSVATGGGNGGSTPDASAPGPDSGAGGNTSTDGGIPNSGADGPTLGDTLVLTGTDLVTMKDPAGKTRLCFTAAQSKAGMSPALSWTGAPPDTKSFGVALFDRTQIRNITYWVIWDIPGTATGLAAGISNKDAMPGPPAPAGSQQKRSMDQTPINFPRDGNGWYGPFTGQVHEFELTLYALKVDPLPVNGADAGKLHKEVLPPNSVAITTLIVYGDGTGKCF